MTLEDFQNYCRKASLLPLSLNKIGSPNFQNFLKYQARQLNCSEEIVFFLILSSCAGCIGGNATLQLTHNWQESPIFWLLLVPYATHNLSIIINKLCQQLIEVQNECGQTGDSSQNWNQFIVEFFDTEGLMNILHSKGSALALYSKLDIFKAVVSSSHSMIQILERLYYGSPLLSNYGSSKQFLAKPSLNIICVAELLPLHKILCKKDNLSELIENCFTFVSWPRYKSANVRETIQPSINLKTLFKTILEIHKDVKMNYKFSAEAQNKFCQYHDRFVTLTQKLQKNRFPIYKDAAKLMVRISIILHVIENALNTITYNITLNQLMWNVDINLDTLNQAIAIVDFLLAQKNMYADYLAISQQETNQATKTPVATKEKHVTFNMQPAESVSIVHLPLSSTVNISSSSTVQSTTTNPKLPEVSLTQVNKPNVPSVPTIVSVCSAGLPVAKDKKEETATNINNSSNLLPDINLPSSVSISVVPESAQSSSDSTVTTTLIASTPNVTVDQTPLSTYLTKAQERFYIRCKQFLHSILTQKEDTISSEQLGKLPISQPDNPSKKSKTSLEFYCYVLRSIADLGFGQCSVLNGNTNTVTFKRKTFDNLKEKQRWLLSLLGISESQYRSNEKGQVEITEKNKSNVVVID